MTPETTGGASASDPATTRRRATALGYDDLAVGDEWESASRTVTQADVATFAGLSGDFNALHMDHAWATAEGPFGKPVAHGLLGLALASGLASTAPRMDTLAFLAVLEWKFLLPVAFGDTVRVVSTVVSIEPQSRGRRAVVTWRRRLLNQEGRTVQDGMTQSLVRKKTGGGETASPKT